MIECDDQLIVVRRLVCPGLAEYYDGRDERAMYSCGLLVGCGSPHTMVDADGGRDFLARHAKLASTFRVVDKLRHSSGIQVRASSGSGGLCLAACLRRPHR